jgi:hypothetical protein
MMVILLKFEFNKEIIEKAKQLGFKVSPYTATSDSVILTRGNEKITLLVNEMGGYYEALKSGIPLQKVSFEGIKKALGMSYQEEAAIEEDVIYKEPPFDLFFNTDHNIWMINTSKRGFALLPDGTIEVLDPQEDSVIKTDEHDVWKWLHD